MGREKGIKTQGGYLKRHTGRSLGLFLAVLVLSGLISPVLAFYHKQNLYDTDTDEPAKTSIEIQQTFGCRSGCPQVLVLDESQDLTLKIRAKVLDADKWNASLGIEIEGVGSSSNDITIYRQEEIVLDAFKIYTFKIPKEIWTNQDWYLTWWKHATRCVVDRICRLAISGTSNYYYPVAGRTAIYSGYSEDVFAGGSCSYQSPYATSRVKDLYFEFGYLIPFLKINYPEHLGDTNDFAFWDISVSIADDTPAKEILGVKYRAVGDTGFKEDYILVDKLEGGFLIPKSLNLVVGVEYEAWLYAQIGNLEYPPVKIIEQTTKTRFKIIGSYLEPILPELPAEITCSVQEHGTFGYFLCLAFSPKRESFNKFLALGDFLKTRIPVGYFYLIKTELEGIKETEPAFALPVVIEELSPLIFTPIKTGLVFVFWFLFILYVFKRIKNLEI